MPEFGKAQILECVPERWFSDRTGASVLSSAFRCLLPHKTEFQTPRAIDLGDAMVLFAWGELWHVRSGGRLRVRTNEEGSVTLHAPEAGEVKKTEEGAWVIVVQPVKTGGATPEAAHNLLMERRHAITGMLTAIIGLPLTFELEFENQLSLADLNTFASASDKFAVRREFMFSPLSNLGRLNAVTDLERRIQASSETDRGRYQQALHWFDLGTARKALRASSTIGWPLRPSC